MNLLKVAYSWKQSQKATIFSEEHVAAAASVACWRAEPGVRWLHLALPAGEIAHLFTERRGAQLSHLLPDVRRRAGCAAPAAEARFSRPVQC